MDRCSYYLSVIMPVYNVKSEYLIESINSILNQTYIFFEFIIICDDPTKEIKKLLDHYQKIDKRIKIIYQNRQGLVSSLNLGCKIAKGNYIARMDADDVSHPDRFDKQIKFFKKNPNVDLCGTWANIIDNDGKIVSSFKPPFSPNLVKWDLHFYCAIAHPTVLIKKNFFEKNGFYEKSNLHCEDYYLWVKAMNNSKMSNIPIILLDLRKHEHNISQKFISDQINCSQKISLKAISTTINMPVSLENVKIILNPSIGISSKITISTIKVLKNLRSCYLCQNSLSEIEKSYIDEMFCNYFEKMEKKFPNGIILKLLIRILLSFYVPKIWKKRIINSIRYRFKNESSTN